MNFIKLKSKFKKLDLDTIIKILVIVLLLLAIVALGSFVIKKSFKDEKEDIGKDVVLPTLSPKPSSKTTPEATFKLTPKPKSSPTPAKISQSEEEAIWEAVYEYAPKIDIDAPSLNFKLDKIVGNYALVQVDAGGDAEGAALILEKVKGHWVVQDFGTYFPEWEEKVPELFEW